MNRFRIFHLTALLGALALLFVSPECFAQFSWQQPHAKVIPNGELEWTPQPFEFQAGAVNRYIDYENGDDNNDGTKASPWKHHPWDKAARGKAAAHGGATTYVFKRGVVYRGALEVKESGRPGEPIRLTSDPSWGSGDAMFYGSRQVTDGWRKAAHPKMPEADKVWAIDLDFPVRTLWMTEGDKVTRIALARDPNWTEPDENDPMSEWYEWDNPRWWTGQHKTRVGRHERHLGIDKDVLTGDKSDYVGGTVWTEWGIVMGSPYPAKIDAYDAGQKAVAFRGPWTWHMSEKIIKGNRYHLEDRPQWLDVPGEFWFDRKGGGGGTLYVRLPEERDPNTAVLEVGKELDLIQAGNVSHLEISGLTFRFTNIGWEYNDPQWSKPYLRAAVFQMNGGGDDIVIRNNTFEHVHKPVRVNVADFDNPIGTLKVLDNVMRYTDHGAIHLSSNFEKKGPNYARIKNVQILRNNLFHIGWRNLSGAHGHAVSVGSPDTCEVAGNFLHRIAGWGISITGAAGNGAGRDVPFCRYLVHHNRVEDPLLKSNDWGGIETWQGGPFYVYNNISINPGGLMHWKAAQGSNTGTPRFGHAYYLDGAFKNYLFNNIAVGRNNTLGSELANETAIQNIISFENTFANNTLYKFVEMTRQQKPDAGRFRYLGNIMYDVSGVVFKHSKSNDKADPNAAHFSQGNNFAYDTIAYDKNVFYDVTGKFGMFEETGVEYETLEAYSKALKEAQALASDVGVRADKPPLANPEKADYRLAPGSDAIDNGVRLWVPWSLYAVVGEWNFLKSNRDPSKVMDEHWYVNRAYENRDMYMDTPRYPLEGVNIDADSYTNGALEDWTEGALVLNGKDQYLKLELAPKEIDEEPGQEQQAAQAESGDSGDEVEMKKTDIGWAVITHPVKAKPGRKFTVSIKSKQPLGNEKIRADLHWLKEAGWGGTNEGGKTPRGTSDPNAFEFDFTPVEKEELYQFLVVAYRTPGGFAEKSALGNANILLDVGDVAQASKPAENKPEPIDPSELPTVDMDTNNFIIELYFKTKHSGKVGMIASKTVDGTGYALSLDESGTPQIALSSGGNAALVKSTRVVNDDQWHHVLVEIDRKANKGTFYIDGKAAGSGALENLSPQMSFSNNGPFQVGMGNDQTYLAATIDFLRVSRGTLAEAQTTIEELYAWQFDGPFLRDFTGAEPEGKRDAGAIELQ